MSIATLSAGLREGLAGLVAPRRCAACDAPAPALICAPCLRRLGEIAQPPALATPAGDVHAAFVYEGVVPAVLHHGKYRDARSALQQFARLAAARIPLELGGGTVIAPVPLGSRRRRERGYNQAEIIASAVAGRLEIGMTAGLVRVRDTAPQVGRSQAERRANLAGAFAWASPRGVPRHLILVDDVYTSGSTTGSAAAALLEAGAERVDVVVAARKL